MVSEGAPKPNSSALNGTNQGMAAAGGGGLLGWWQNITAQHGPTVEHHVKKAVTKAQSVKWSMPVDVKVDFLRPTIETVKETLTTAWQQLPPPVQQAAPFAGAAVGGGLIVFIIQQRRVNHHRRKEEEHFVQVRALQKEKEELLKRINLLKVKSGSPRSEVEARMASAVAEATNAAAAAADAAARAATACIFHRPPVSSGNGEKSYSNGLPPYK